jgi:nucleotide-binding universal stress UspA family protein
LYRLVSEQRQCDPTNTPQSLNLSIVDNLEEFVIDVFVEVEEKEGEGVEDIDEEEKKNKKKKIVMKKKRRTRRRR